MTKSAPQQFARVRRARFLPRLLKFNPLDKQFHHGDGRQRDGKFWCQCHESRVLQRTVKNAISTIVTRRPKPARMIRLAERAIGCAAIPCLCCCSLLVSQWGVRTNILASGRGH
jgi:hypothetical protein